MPKYRNRKTENGFDSVLEEKRYYILAERERRGEISDLETQHTFVLIPSQRDPDTVGSRGGIKKGKVIERELVYIADFVYTKDGQTVVEDVKGYRNPADAAYRIFKIKKKLMRWIYQINVIEITKNNIGA